MPTHRLIITALLFGVLTVNNALAVAVTADSVCDNDNEHTNSAEDCLDEIMHPDLERSVSATSLRIGGEINAEATNEYWLQKGKEFIRQQAKLKFNTRTAKNIILFVGDGMSLTTLTASRNIIGGEAEKLSFEKFPYTGFAKTYAVNNLVPDSACAATALLCGVKANRGTIGVNAHVERMNCAGMQNVSNHVDSIAKWSLDAGKMAGLVTTTRVTHATPAAVYAHSADREWENDALLAADCGAQGTELPDIALQLVNGEVGKKLKVILGGGKREFVDAKFYKKGKREDGRDLIAEFLQQSALNAYVQTRKQLMNLNLNAHQCLLGLFHKSHLEYNLVADETQQPTLAEMTMRAIEMLQQDNEKGFFLFVEGGHIDMAHHKNLAEFALDETVELAKAVEAARNLTAEEDTLIVVTADHSHAFSISGYQNRGSDIFDIAPSMGADEEPYLALSYANGPGFEQYYNIKKHRRRNAESVHALYDIYPATVPMDSATHSGEDVAVFASGPWAHLFTGVYEQNVIPHLMAYAACVGERLKAC